MDREDESVLAHLRAENEFLSQNFRDLKPLEDELFEEIKGRIEETDISVPVRKGAWWYSRERAKDSTTRSVVAWRPSAMISRPRDRPVDHARRRAGDPR